MSLLRKLKKVGCNCGSGSLVSVKKTVTETENAEKETTNQCCEDSKTGC